jgi:hypothetical protein
LHNTRFRRFVAAFPWTVSAGIQRESPQLAGGWVWRLDGSGSTEVDPIIGRSASASYKTVTLNDEQPVDANRSRKRTPNAIRSWNTMPELTAPVTRIPLGLRPWLHRLRRGLLHYGLLRSGARRFVRRLHSYYGEVRRWSRTPRRSFWQRRPCRRTI